MSSRSLSCTLFVFFFSLLSTAAADGPSEKLVINTATGEKVEISDPLSVFVGFAEAISQTKLSDPERAGGTVQVTLPNGQVVEVADAKAAMQSLWSVVSRTSNRQQETEVRVRQANGETVAVNDIGTTFEQAWQVITKAKAGENGAAVTTAPLSDEERKALLENAAAASEAGQQAAARAQEQAAAARKEAARAVKQAEIAVKKAERERTRNQ